MQPSPASGVLKLAFSTVLVCAVIAAAVLVWTWVDFAAVAKAADEWNEMAPLQGAVAGVLLYALWACLLPTTLPELLLGYVFGLLEGWVINFLGKLLSSVLCYVLGRTILRSWLHNIWLSGGKHELLCAFEDEVVERPYQTAFLMRVAYAPMSVKNYGMALIGVPPAPFFAVFFLVEVLDSYLLVAVGAGAHSLQDLLRGDGKAGEQRRAWLQLVLLAFQLAVLGMLLVHLGKMASQAIARRRERLANSGGQQADGNVSVHHPAAGAAATGVSDKVGDGRKMLI